MKLSLPEIGSFTTVDGIRYVVTKGTLRYPYWDGGARGGCIYPNWLQYPSEGREGTISDSHPYKTYRSTSTGVSHRTIVQAALSAQKWAKHRYEEAVRFKAAYEAQAEAVR